MDIKKKPVGHSKILLDIINNEINITDALFRLKIILSTLSDDMIGGWLKGELEGYDDGDAIPPYRVVRAPLFGKVMLVGFGKIIYQEMQIPIKLEHSDALKVSLHENISILENWAKDDSLDKKMSIDLRLANNIAALELSDRCQIMNAWRIIPPASYSKITNSVKTKIIDILLNLEKQYGNLDEYSILYNNDLEKTATINFITNIIYKDGDINVGNNNDLSKAIVGDKNEYKSRKQK